MDKLKITKKEDLQKFNEGEIVELPSFDDNTPFVAKLKRPSLLALCKGGQIPNTLLGSAQELFEGKQKSDIKKYAEILDVVLTAAMVEPQYGEVEGILTDMQKLAIFAFTQSGIKALIPFREIERIQKGSNISKE
jgi:hypothetical protein